MRSIFYFSLGVLLAFGLFWPAAGFAVSWTQQSQYQHYSNDSCYVGSSSLTIAGAGYSKTIDLSNDGSINYYLYNKDQIFDPVGTTSSLACTYGFWRSTDPYNWWAGANFTYNAVTYPNRVYRVVDTNPGGTGYCKLEYSDDYVVPDPAHCSDNSISGDETGQDCGGSCTPDCVISCPDDYEGLIEIGETEISICQRLIPTDIYGNCPAGFTKFGSGGTIQCMDEVEPVSAAAGETTTAIQTANGWYELPQNYTPGTFNVIGTYDYSVTDNQDGTSTVVEVSGSTQTGANPSETTTTKTTIINTSTGQPISSETVVEGTLDPTENPANYDTEFGTVPVVNIPTMTNPDITNYYTDPDYTVLDDAINETGILNIFEDTEVETESSMCTVDFGIVYGRQITANFCNYQSQLETIGSILYFLAYVAGLILLVS